MSTSEPFKCQINPACLPGFADLHQQGTHQPQAGSFVRRNASHPGSSSDFKAHSQIDVWNQGDYLGGKPGLISPGYTGIREVGIPFWILAWFGLYGLARRLREGLTPELIALSLLTPVIVTISLLSIYVLDPLRLSRQLSINL